MRADRKPAWLQGYRDWPRHRAATLNPNFAGSNPARPTAAYVRRGSSLARPSPAHIQRASQARFRGDADPFAEHLKPLAGLQTPVHVGKSGLNDDHGWLLGLRLRQDAGAASEKTSRPRGLLSRASTTLSGSVSSFWRMASSIASPGLRRCFLALRASCERLASSRKYSLRGFGAPGACSGIRFDDSMERCVTSSGPSPSPIGARA
jgi:hypothetical protein